MTDELSLKPHDALNERLDVLRDEFPEVFTEGKVDFEKLRHALGDEVVAGRERYGLSWAGKSEAVRNIQTPSVATLVPDRAESVEFDSTENLFIEGDNLEVLKLLQKSYHGQVKMIYIDPPYNTGNEFIYPDNFREGIEDYLRFSGQVDDEGMQISTNTETSGRYHSTWLSMIYPRLFLARNLLRDDGVIFVSIGDHELHNLRHLMDEIYGEENFLATFAWKRRAPSAMAEKLVSVDHEYVVAYHRSSFEKLRGIGKDYSNFSNPDNDPNGDWVSGDLTVGMGKDQRPNQYYDLVDPETGNVFQPNPNRVWAFVPSSMNKLIEEGKVIFPSDTSRRPMLKRYKKNLKSEVNPVSTWIRGLSEKTDDSEVETLESGMTAEGTRKIQELFGSTIFNYSKPVSLIFSLINYATEEDDLILDFFAGSATTAQALLEANNSDNGNRKFIMVQLPEPTDNSEYPTIADIGKARIKQVIKKMNEEDDSKLKSDDFARQSRGFKVFKLTSSNFETWDGTAIGNATKDDSEISEHLLDAVENVKEDASPEDMLYEVLLRAGWPLTTEVEKEKVANREVFSADSENSTMFVCLEDPVTEELLREIMNRGPAQVVCLDTAFHGNDQLKTNTVLEMRDREIKFRTI